MVRIYNSQMYFKSGEVIVDNESFFNNNVFSHSFSKNSLMSMLVIDKAKLLDENTGKIETPFGIADIKDLSTGCKTVLNCIYVNEHPEVYPSVKAINATECGWNAIEELFKYIETRGCDIAVVIEHDNDLYKCNDRVYILNGKEEIHSMYDFYLGG